MGAEGLKIGEVASRSGVSIDTVRYYERKKLLPYARRSAGGFRLFSPEIIERIYFIKHAQEIGLSLNEVKELLEVEGRGGAGECQRMSELLQGKLQELDLRLKAMRQFRGTLARYLSACEGELKRRGDRATCPVVVEIKRH